MSRAGAAVAQGCEDGSSMFFNPANLVDTDGITLSAGATLIAAGGSYTSGITGEESDLQNDPIPVPHFYASYRFNDKTAAGLGVYVPYGLSTEWKPSFEGAFEGYNNGVQSIYVQPTFSYKVAERLRVGGGPIIAISAVELNQRLDLSAQRISGADTPTPEDDVYFANIGIPHHTAFADAKLEGSNQIGFGANVGVTYQATDALRFGARFTSPVKVTFDGDATFTQVNTGLQTRAALPGIPAGTPVDQIVAPQFESGGPLVDQAIETEITFPAQVVVGTSFDVTPKLTVLADYQFTGWSSLGDIPLDFESDALDDERVLNYDNTHAFRFGGEYEIIDQVTARVGYLYNTAAAPDATVTPLLPESNRNQFTVGFGWQPTDLLQINASYQYLGQNDRLGRVRDVRPGESVESLAELNEGIYSFDAHLFGLTLTLHL
jgi:long-chain fatty acid transport protein